MRVHVAGTQMVFLYVVRLDTHENWAQTFGIFDVFAMFFVYEEDVGLSIFVRPCEQ